MERDNAVIVTFSLLSSHGAMLSSAVRFNVKLGIMQLFFTFSLLSFHAAMLSSQV